MVYKNFSLKYLFFTVILITVFNSCKEQNLMIGNGVLKGKISIGPICPVETDPPAPGCLPTMETYKAWATAVWTLDKKTKLVKLDPKLDGTYQLGLPTGDYVIDFDSIRTSRIGGSNLPTAISVANMDTTYLDISIDTGIR